MKKGNIFKQTLNTRYFGRKSSFFDKDMHTPKKPIGKFEVREEKRENA